MSSLMLTYFLAITNMVIIIYFLWWTRHHIITLLHVGLVSTFFAFSIRPIVDASMGGYTLYPTSLGWNYYNLGLIYQIIFEISFLFGYIVLYKNRKRNMRISLSRSLKKGYLSSLFSGMIVVFLIAILSHGNWLASNRSTTITSTLPLGKILFPMAIIPLSVSFPLAYLCYKHSNLSFKFLLLIGLVIAFLSMDLLYERGFLISSFILILFFYEKSKKIKYRWLILFIVFALLLATFLRPLALFLSGSTKSGGNFGSPIDAMLSFFKGANFDSADVWPVAMEYVKEKGLLFGTTFLNLPFTFFSPAMRHQYGFLLAVDRLNAFYWGNFYWFSNFGFNVSTPQEVLMNFGPSLLPVFGFIVGVMTSLFDKWLWSFSKINIFTVYLVAAIFQSGGNLISGSIEWFIAFIIVGFFLDHARLALLSNK